MHTKNPIMEQQTSAKGPKLGFEWLLKYNTLHYVGTACTLCARRSPMVWWLGPGLVHHGLCTTAHVFPTLWRSSD